MKDTGQWYFAMPNHDRLCHSRQLIHTDQYHTWCIIPSVRILEVRIRQISRRHTSNKFYVSNWFENASTFSKHDRTTQDPAMGRSFPGTTIKSLGDDSRRVDAIVWWHGPEAWAEIVLTRRCEKRWLGGEKFRRSQMFSGMFPCPRGRQSTQSPAKQFGFKFRGYQMLCYWLSVWKIAC